MKQTGAAAGHWTDDPGLWHSQHSVTARPGLGIISSARPTKLPNRYRMFEGPCAFIHWTYTSIGNVRSNAKGCPSHCSTACGRRSPLRNSELCCRRERREGIRRGVIDTGKSLPGPAVICEVKSSGRTGPKLTPPLATQATPDDDPGSGKRRSVKFRQNEPEAWGLCGNKSGPVNLPYVICISTKSFSEASAKT